MLSSKCDFSNYKNRLNKRHRLKFSFYFWLFRAYTRIEADRIHGRDTSFISHTTVYLIFHLFLFIFSAKDTAAEPQTSKDETAGDLCEFDTETGEKKSCCLRFIKFIYVATCVINIVSNSQISIIASDFFFEKYLK